MASYLLNEIKYKIIYSFLTILMVVLVIFIFNLLQTKSNKNVVIRLQLISSAIEKYYFDEKELPETNIGLTNLIFSKGNNEWNGPYLPYQNVPKDSWNNDYIYKTFNDFCYILYSIGQNKIDEFGSGDDLYVKNCVTQPRKPENH